MSADPTSSRDHLFSGAPALLLLALAVFVWACADAASGGPSVTREVVGDTTIVRIAGATTPDTAVQEVVIGELEGADEYTFGNVQDIAVADDGTMYVLDGQTLNIRVYSPDGTHVRTFGRQGEGPGELKQPYGMLFLSDGRLVVRDAGNARMNVYSRDGESLTTWPIPGGFITSAPIFRDEDDNVYTDIIAVRHDDGSWRTGMLRLSSSGEWGDTVVRPYVDYEPPRLTATRVSGNNRSMSMSNVPFWPQALSAMNRNGEFIGGIADRYAVFIWRSDGTVLRIERDVAPVPVDQAEAAAAIERVTRSMQNLDGSWSWDGPQPPPTKPAFTEIRVGDDNRIWIRISQPGVRQPPDPDAERDARGRMPVDQWLEPTVYEVFESDGDYVGAVRLPDRFRPMTIRGGHVWGVLRDEYDVQYVARLSALPDEPAP
ncbi:MAG TPA: 6-bladed beta-propeller [Longimicrobiales bacterium]